MIPQFRNIHGQGDIRRYASWNALDTFAIRTCVPASAQSRLKGAGAGLLEAD